MEHLLRSVAKTGHAVRKVVHTSSGAAGGTLSVPVAARRNNPAGGHGATGGGVRKPAPADAPVVDDAYGRAKRDCETVLYEFCRTRNELNRAAASNDTTGNDRSDDRGVPEQRRHDLVGASVCPCIVLGPLAMGDPPLHDGVYPHRLSDMLRGRYTLDQSWEIADVRDVAETHRLAAEAGEAGGIPAIANGTRFWNGSEPPWEVEELLEYIVHHEDFAGEKRFSVLPLGADGDSSGSGSDSVSESCGGGDRDGEEHGSGEGSRSSSCSSGDDSFGVSEWDRVNDDNDDDDNAFLPPEGERQNATRTTTWSDPVAFFGDSYRPRDPRQTVLETARSIAGHWDLLGRDLTLRECSGFYTVAEMDGCEEEMKWLEGHIDRRHRRELGLE